MNATGAAKSPKRTSIRLSGDMKTPATRAMRFAAAASPWTDFFRPLQIRIAASAQHEGVPPGTTKPAASIEQLVREMEQGILERTSEQEALHRFATEQGASKTAKMINRSKNQCDLGMHLVYLGLRHGREEAVMDGIALMDRIRDLALRLLAEPGKYQNRNFMERFADTLRAGASHGGERHIQEMKNAAAAVTIGDEFDRLSMKCPHYHPDGTSHDLKDAIRGMHEQPFRFRRDGLYAELCYAFANRSEQDAKKR